MKNVYYVQRLKKPVNYTNPFSFGGGLIDGGFNPEAMKIIKDIMSFDYMGSAEFEWGAVPTAIKSLVTHQSLSTFELSGMLKPVYVICPTNIELEVSNWIKNASKEEPQLKERLGFRNALAGKEYSDYAGWLKIENDRDCQEPFMFFLDKTMFDNMCKLIGLSNS